MPKSHIEKLIWVLVTSWANWRKTHIITERAMPVIKPSAGLQMESFSLYPDLGELGCAWLCVSIHWLYNYKFYVAHRSVELNAVSKLVGFLTTSNWSGCDSNYKQKSTSNLWAITKSGHHCFDFNHSKLSVWLDNADHLFTKNTL